MTSQGRVLIGCDLLNMTSNCLHLICRRLRAKWAFFLMDKLFSLICWPFMRKKVKIYSSIQKVWCFPLNGYKRSSYYDILPGSINSTILSVLKPSSTARILSHSLVTIGWRTRVLSRGGGILWGAGRARCRMVSLTRELARNCTKWSGSGHSSLDNWPSNSSAIASSSGESMGELPGHDVWKKHAVDEVVGEKTIGNAVIERSRWHISSTTLNKNIGMCL